MRNVIPAFLCLLLVIPCSAKTIIVDANGSADCDNIQEAIHNAVNGDVVVVNPGIYTGPGNRDIDFLGKPLAVRSTDPNDPNIVAATIVDCNGTEVEPHRGFYFHSQEDSNSVLSGLTITNGYGLEEQLWEPMPLPVGGGIFCKNSSPKISNCVIRDGSALYGGGIFCYLSRPVLNDCAISGNFAAEGGGMYNYENSSATLINCTFSDNSAGSRGGGMVNLQSDPDVSRCLFVSNSAGPAGGGVCNLGCSPTFTNCRFVGNSAPMLWITGGGGGGVNNCGGSPVLTNCIFSGNWAGGGDAMSNEASQPTLTNCTFTGNGDPPIVNWWEDTNLTLTNCILWDHTDNEIWNIHDPSVTVTYTNVKGGWPGLGNIDMDPCFVELGYWGDVNDPNIVVEPNDPNAIWIDGDYHLLARSPCIDAGDNNSLPADIGDINGDGNTTEPIPWDLDGNPRIADGNNDGNCVVDMGAYEFQGPRTLYVDDDGPADFNSIQPAIDSASDGDTIIVQPGLYGESIHFLGKKITLTSTIPANPNVVAATTIEGGVVFSGTEDPNCTLAGFNINEVIGIGPPLDSNGFPDPNYEPQSTHATISHCVLQGNIVPHGTVIGFCDGTITNCLIGENIAGDTILPVISPAINYCHGLIKNCTIVNNYSAHGIGVAWNDGRITIQNCIIRGNMGHQIFAPIGATVNILYTNMQDGLGGISGGGQTNWGPGNIDTDPRFVREGHWDFNEPRTFFEGDYHLLLGSPCINGGDPNYIAEPNETDPDGKPRVIAGRIDMGVYEFNHIPVAEAGPNQIVYAWIDGIAEVTLDGNDSYDPDADELTYLWTWMLDGNTYEANGVSPTIELDVGVHTIQLIVSDGIEDSEPDYVDVNVVAPLEADLRMMPRVINRYSRMPRIMAFVRLPEGITKDEIDRDELLMLYPDASEEGIEAERQFVIPCYRCRTQRTYIFAFFDKAELMDAVPYNGRVELEVVGSLKTGQYFYGSDTVWIIKRWPRWWRRWRRW